MVSDRYGRGAVICGGSRAGSHGLGNDLQLMGTRLAVLLLVLHLRIVLQEKLTGLLQHSAALTDGAAGRPEDRLAQYSLGATDRIFAPFSLVSSSVGCSIYKIRGSYVVRSLYKLRLYFC